MSDSVAQIVSWLLIISGWLVINRQHNQREDRKELRTQLDKLIALLISLEGDAISYHLANEIESSSARNIKVKLKRVSHSVRHLSLGKVTDVNRRVISLRRAITLENFDTVHHTPQDPRSDLVDAINHSLDELVNYLEDAFRQKYPRI